jgi:hypothetical protein
MRQVLPLIAPLLLAFALLGAPPATNAGGKPRPDARGRVTIQNPCCLYVPAQRVQVVHNIICQVVAREFRVDESNLDCRLTLVLGAEQERSAADEANGIYSVYLARWGEPTFVISDMRLAIQRMVSRERWQRMTREIVRRVDELAPVDANVLQKPTTAFLPPDSGWNEHCPSSPQ